MIRSGALSLALGLVTCIGDLPLIDKFVPEFIIVLDTQEEVDIGVNESRLSRTCHTNNHEVEASVSFTLAWALAFDDFDLFFFKILFDILARVLWQKRARLIFFIKLQDCFCRVQKELRKLVI